MQAINNWLLTSNFSVANATVTYEAWKHIPSAYVVALEDKSIPLKQVREIVKKAGIELVLEVKAGHCAYISQAEPIAEFIRKAAGETEWLESYFSM